MSEISVHDLVHGRVIVTFDGTVVEVFTERHASVQRFHRSMLTLNFSGPDRNDRYQVQLSTGRSAGAGFDLTIDAAGWTATHGFWTELHGSAAPTG